VLAALAAKHLNASHKNAQAFFDRSFSGKIKSMQCIEFAPLFMMRITSARRL
jgi:hypothetical protein